MVYNNFMEENNQRDQSIFDEYVNSETATLRSIAAKHGISHQRVAAIIGRMAKKEENGDKLDQFMSKWME